MASQKTGPSLKEKAIEELRKFWAIAIYLSVMLAAFV